jgi:hypothetical protein
MVFLYISSNIDHYIEQRGSETLQHNEPKYRRRPNHTAHTIDDAPALLIITNETK